MSTSFIILVTSLLLLYILYQYNHHCQPIQAIDQGLHHTEVVCNNYTFGYPMKIENDPYCEPIQAIDQGLQYTPLEFPQRDHPTPTEGQQDNVKYTSIT